MASAVYRAKDRDEIAGLMEGSNDSTKKVDIERKYCPTCFNMFEGSISHCPVDNTILIGPKNDPMIGKLFADRYEVESVLGLGGMSVVYKAKHALMKRTVAIKMLHKSLKDDPTASDRFQLEAQAAASLNHQNIVTVYDFGVAPGGEPYFVMDCLEGESLKDLIERKGFVPYQRALPIFRQICDGLDAAHKKGIIHRDLKPANVVLLKQDDGSELVKIVDFGIAKLLPRAGEDQLHLTQTGEVFGSPVYMSPEQCMGKTLDTRSDIYGLGCLMYETLTGDPPLRGNGFLETMNMHVNKEPEPMSQHLPEGKIPEILDSIVLKCVAKKPEDRFQTAGEVRDVIAGVSLELLGASGSYLTSVSGATKTLQSLGGTVKSQPVRKVSVRAVLATIFGVTTVAVVGFVTFFPGPDKDRGTPLCKMIWQSTMANADQDLKDRNFAAAEKNLLYAESFAKDFGDGKQRLEATLRDKATLYDQWENHAEELEKVNIAIARIQDERVKLELEHQQGIIEAFSKAAKNSTPVQESNLKQDMEAQFPGLVNISGKLSGRGMNEELQKLIEHALEVEKPYLGPNSPVVAQMDTILADCLIAQRKFGAVRAHLCSACEIRRARKALDQEGFVRALAKLGQFDLDQSDFKNAEVELKEAYALVLRPQFNAKHSSDLAEVAVLTIRSYAELLRQTNKKSESEKLLAESAALDAKLHK